MALFRHVGTTSAIADTPHEFNRFGQKVELDEQFAHERIADGLPLLPEAKWKEIGFTDKEVADYPAAQQHAGAPQSFRDKKHKALLALHDLRESLKNPVAPSTELFNPTFETEDHEA